MSETDEGNTENDNWFSPTNPNFPYNETYQRLQEFEIRLILLLAGTPVQPISCELISEVFIVPGTSPTLEYEALSYCAGDPRSTKPVLVNGHSFNVFASLHSALHHLRDEQTDKLLWIDQVCINQTDLEERGKQVLLMRDIYRNAITTQGWLGDILPEATSDGAHQALTEFEGHNAALLVQSFKGPAGELNERQWQTRIMECERTNRLRQIPGLIEMLTWICEYLARPINDGAPQALRDVIGHPWWKRCWVTQECVVSTNIQLNFRGRKIPWQILVRLLFLIQRINMESIKPKITEWFQIADELKRESHQINHIQMLRYSFHVEEANKLNRPGAEQRPDPLNIMTVLSTTQGRKASDPRDKIYALLGLVDTSFLPQYGIHIDYRHSCTAQELFIKVTTMALRVHKTLEPLVYAGLDQSSTGLPSWVSTWSRTPHATAPSWTILENGARAGGQGEPRLSFSNEGRHLILDGHLLDIVTEMVSEPFTVFSLDSWRNYMRMLEPLLENLVATHEDGWAEALTTLDATFVLTRRLPWHDMKIDAMRAQGQLLEAYAQRLFAESNAQRFHSYKRCFFTTAGGKLGLCDRHCQVGDELCVALGSQVPYVLRLADEGEGGYVYVGEAYVAEWMDGSVVKQKKQDGEDAIDIMLV